MRQVELLLHIFIWQSQYNKTIIVYYIRIVYNINGIIIQKYALLILQRILG